MKNRLNTYKIQDWVVLGRKFFKPPFKVSDTLINEARIAHVVHGHSKLYAANQFTTLHDGDTLIMKSDNFINRWQANEDKAFNTLIVFQLTSDMLKQIYQNQLPKWFIKSSAHQISPIQKQNAHFLLDDYFKNLTYYLDNPFLISENLLSIKIQELLHILVKTDTSGNNQKILGSLFQANEYKFHQLLQTIKLTTLA